MALRTPIPLLRRLALIFGAVVVLLGAVGCSSQSSGESGVQLGSNAILLDVRTPGEYAQGHLEGVRLLDLNGGQVEAMLPTLDRDAEYYVYCRSGNRSAQAINLMKQAGISNVTNLGSLEKAAAATGLPIVAG